MPCYSPLDAYYSKEIGRTGKRGITFDRNASFSGVKLRLPCGQCIGCRLERSRQWAMRCLHEKQMHMLNCFLTLTYDNDHLPEGNTLVKRDLQLFMKRLRKWYFANYGEKVRFYACGEYGETTKRPHYHVLLFNCDFADKKFYKSAGNGKRLYTSQFVSDLWPMGFNVIGDVDFDSAAYVARYVCGKITGDIAAKHYEYVDRYGVVHDRLPEFNVMSRAGGIGLEWFKKYGSQVYVWDSVIMNAREVRPPRYYDSKFEVIDTKRLEELKLKRRRKAMQHRADNGPDRRRVREAVAIATLKQKRSEL